MDLFGKQAAEAQRLLDRGIECFRSNRIAEAEGHFRAAASLAPKRPEAHHDLGVALAALGRLDEAVASLREALRLRPANLESQVALADIAKRQERPWDAAAHLREAIRIKPDFAAAHCNLGLLLDDLGEAEEAREMLRRAVELEPANEDFRMNLRILCARDVPMWHFSMMNDARRNAAYEAALRRVVRPDSLVLEIGTGSGLVSLMAARAGARHVVTCEMVAALAAKARQIIARNGYSGRITVITGKSSEVQIPGDLPEPADVLVSEIISSDLIGEGLLGTYEDARRLVKPDAAIIPSRAWVRGQLVSAEGLERFVSAGSIAGFDLSEFNDFRPLKVHPAEAEVDFQALSHPFDVFQFDLRSAARFAPQREHLSISVSRRGECAGVLQWVRLELAEDTFYENAPYGDEGIRRAGHWQQVLHLFAQPVAVREAERAVIVAYHNRRNLLFRFETLESPG